MKEFQSGTSVKLQLGGIILHGYSADFFRERILRVLVLHGLTRVW